MAPGAVRASAWQTSRAVRLVQNVCSEPLHAATQREQPQARGPIVLNGCGSHVESRGGRRPAAAKLGCRHQPQWRDLHTTSAGPVTTRPCSLQRWGTYAYLGFAVATRNSPRAKEEDKRGKPARDTAATTGAHCAADNNTRGVRLYRFTGCGCKCAPVRAAATTKARAPSSLFYIFALRKFQPERTEPLVSQTPKALNLRRHRRHRRQGIHHRW